MFRQAAFLLALTVTLFAADPSGAVREAAVGWIQAAVKQDKAGLERLLADDLIYTHSSGRLTQTKAEYIATVTKGAPTYNSLDYSDLKIRVYEGAAVATAYIAVKLVGREPFRVKSLQLYVERNGQWQLVAFQSERLDP